MNLLNAPKIYYDSLNFQLLWLTSPLIVVVIIGTVNLHTGEEAEGAFALTIDSRSAAGRLLLGTCARLGLGLRVETAEVCTHEGCLLALIVDFQDGLGWVSPQ